MSRRPVPPPEPIEELKPNEEFISRDDLTIEVIPMDEDGESTVYVRFSGFEDDETAEEYAAFLQDTLPLLLFETTRFH